MEIDNPKKRSNKHDNEISTEASSELIGEIKTEKYEIMDVKDEAPKKNRKIVSYEEKKSILEELNSIPAELVREKYGICERTLRHWKKQKDKIYEACESSSGKAKTLRPVKELDDQVLSYVLNSNVNGTPVTGMMVRQEALQINKALGGPQKFRASEGWLSKWKIRKQVRSVQIADREEVPRRRGRRRREEQNNSGSNEPLDMINFLDVYGNQTENTNIECQPHYVDVNCDTNALSPASSMTDSANDPSPEKRQRVRSSSKEDEKRYIEESIETEDLPTDSADSRVTDEVDAFCMRVAASLRRLVPKHRSKVEIEILKLVYEAEFGEVV